MADPFIGEIRLFAGNFAPRGWAFCDGQLLPINQNQALFALLGTTYGGDGRVTFALPNLQGRAPVHFGQGPGLSNVPLGAQLGSATVTLDATQMPAHTHALRHIDAPATDTDPEGRALATPAQPVWGESPGAQVGAMRPGAVGDAGGGQPHDNLQPYLVVSYIIALQGIFPARN